MFKKYLSVILLITLSAHALHAQNELREQIKKLAKPANGIVGVSVLGLEDRDTLNYNGNARMVMQSVMKLPIAIAVLHQVDLGKLKLDQTIHISKRDLPPTYSPLRDKYPDGKVNIPISELLSYMVSLSDNNACDILLKKLGGTKPVMDYLHELGIKGIAVNASEAEMAASWEVQFTNWCKPIDVIQLLDMFYQGKTLSKSNTDMLMKVMFETTTGPKQIKGLLPTNTLVAHKTGSSGTNDAGLTPATNDVGIITLPNGKHLAIAIFVCNSLANETTRNEVIANIAKAVWGQDVDIAAANPITGFKNIAYSFHFYASDPHHQDNLRVKGDKAIKMGLPLLVTEWGVGESNGDGKFDLDKNATWLKWMDDNKLSWTNWNLTDKKETTAILLPGASKNGNWPLLT